MHDVLVAEAFLAEMCRKDNTLSLAKILDEDDVAIPIRHHRSAYMTAAGTGMCMHETVLAERSFTRAIS